MTTADPLVELVAHLRHHTCADAPEFAAVAARIEALGVEHPRALDAVERLLTAGEPAEAAA